jgi:hypothetical protein
MRCGTLLRAAAIIGKTYDGLQQARPIQLQTLRKPELHTFHRSSTQRSKTTAIG